MNKDKQIEEIEQFIYDYVDSKQTERVTLCSSRVNALAKPFVHNKALASALYNAGYRKVPNGAVILTPEERDEELKACNEKQAELENEIYGLKTNYDCLCEHCTDLENKNVAAENMIDSQAKEIDRLKADNEALKMWNEAYTEENEKLKGQNHKLENDLSGFDEFARGISKTRIEITGEAIPTCKTLLEYIKKEKRNAAKEFVEKLKAKAHSVVGFNVRKRVYAKEYTINEIDIDKILKEFLK